MKFKPNWFGVFALFIIFTIVYLLWKGISQTDYKKIESDNLIRSKQEAVVRSFGLGRSMQYFKDDRTGKCFGLYRYIAEGYKHYSVTDTKCTPEVEELIEQGVKE